MLFVWVYLKTIIFTQFYEVRMNKTNRALMGTLLGIALVFVVVSFVMTLLGINGAESYSEFKIDFSPFDLFGNLELPASVHDAYWGLVDVYTQFAEDLDSKRYLVMILLMIGFALVIAGFASKPTKDTNGKEDDPKQYLFTHRPNGILKILMTPWNILTVAWGFKKIPVILPLIFVPFMLPFALLADVILLIVYLVAWLVMEVRIRAAASKDKEIYDRDTQYAICPKCKRNFYQPNVKCDCGLVVSFPVPDRHGIKYHTCNKGHKIPSTNEDGLRSQLKSVCPHCKGNILTHEAKPIALSMVGSVNSGKTTLMVSAVESIGAMAKSKGILCEIVTDGISLEAQRDKSRITPTQAGELDSEYFFLRVRDMPEKEILINDISGTEFQPDEEKIFFEEYYRYNDGIIFTIDPLEVMALYHSQSPTKGSKDTPTAIFESFYYMYAEINGYGPTVRSTVPLAIVLTKMDNPKVMSAVKAEGSPKGFLEKYGSKAISDIAESSFQNVKYFTVASLGDSINAADPFVWIISENDKDLKTKLF